MDVSVEANPYYYKLAPGKEAEFLYPMYSALVQFMKESTKQKVVKMPKDFEKNLEQVEKNLEKLKKGGYVGTPRRKYMG